MLKGELKRGKFMKYRVYTSYCLEVDAKTPEEAERIAQEDISKRIGIDGNWVWCEDFDTIQIDN